MISLHLPSRDDADEIVNSLLKDAAILDVHAPQLAARKRALARRITRGLDALPPSTPRKDGPDDGR